MDEFIIYVNRVHGFANVHRLDCGFVRMRGGISDTDPPTGWYISGFDTLSKADFVARWTEYSVSHCQNCIAAC